MKEPREGLVRVDYEKARAAYTLFSTNNKNKKPKTILRNEGPINDAMRQRILGEGLKNHLPYGHVARQTLQNFARVVGVDYEMLEYKDAKFSSDNGRAAPTAKPPEQPLEGKAIDPGSDAPHSSGDTHESRKHHEEAIRLTAAVRTRIFQLLRESANVTSKLSNSLGRRKDGESTGDQAKDLADALVQSQWEDAIGALKSAHDDFISFNNYDHGSYSIIKKITREFVVLLFSSEELARLRAQMDQQLGALIEIPVRSETFVEIVMARLEGRKPFFSSASKEDHWISGANAMANPPIEGPDNFMGFVRAFEEVIFHKYPHASRPDNGETCACNEFKGEETAARCKIFQDLLIETSKETVEVAKQVTKRGRLYFLLRDDNRYPVDNAGFREILEGLQKEWSMIPFIRLSGDNARLSYEIKLLWAIRQWLVEDNS